MKNDQMRKWIQGLKEKEERLLFSKILDRYSDYQKTGISTASDFLNITEKNMVENGLNYLHIPYNIYTANDSCERFIIYFGEFANFVSFYRIPNISTCHSHVLGSLFGCGFSNSMIGDIFVQEDVVYFTNLTKYNRLLENSFTMIGKEKIQLQTLESFPYIVRKFQDFVFSVSSTRIDLLVSKLSHISRSKIDVYMKEKQILVNYQTVSKNKCLKMGDILSIQNIGKFIIREVSSSKNGKIRIVIQKYC